MSTDSRAPPIHSSGLEFGQQHAARNEGRESRISVHETLRCAAVRHPAVLGDRRAAHDQRTWLLAAGTGKVLDRQVKEARRSKVLSRNPRREAEACGDDDDGTDGRLSAGNHARRLAVQSLDVSSVRYGSMHLLRPL
jgi:hypothetical protein